MTVVLGGGVVVLAALALVALRRRGSRLEGRRAGLQVAELQRLHRAELAVASAPSPYAAAKELAGHVLALLDAPVAVVLIEGAEDNVRVLRGGPDADATAVYEPGSRMRLLSVDGTPVGSIAVAPRPDGRAYGERDEKVLDTLAQLVSGTLQRLALFEEVRNERRTLADLLDSSSDAIAAVGPDLRVQAWNPAMAGLTGVAADDAVGQTCCSVFRPEDEEGTPRHGAACPCRGDEPVELLLSLRSPTGVRWLLTAFSPRASGGSVVVARDITARKQLDDEKVDFLATVSHELRTPLTPLKGFIQTLVQRGEQLSSGERGHVYQVLLREEERLERLVDQLLKATTAEHGTAERTVAFDWCEIVDHRVEAFARLDPTREVEITLPFRPVGMLADPSGAGHVLEELLANAAKFGPAGSLVRVVVTAGDGWVTTTVEDAGPGVPEADRERVFERFTRLGDHLTRPQQGVGLGLYIVRKAVEAMGGQVTCGRSEVLGGAAFTVRLPMADLPVTPLRS